MTTRIARRRATTASSMPSRSRRRRVVSAATGAVVLVAAVAGAMVTGVLATGQDEITPSSQVAVAEDEIAPPQVLVAEDVTTARADEPLQAGSQTIQVTIPDLQAQVSQLGAAAPYGLRRAACHQQTGMDDESVEPLATCIADIPGDAPRP